MVPIVREFYANVADRTDCKSFVTGRLVFYDFKEINQFLGTPPIDDPMFESWLENLDWERIMRTICLRGSTWKTPGTYNCFV